jgi:Arc/MetJ family transcription regulator
MRTNIDLDEELLREFQELSNSKTKREAVNKALEESIRAYKVRRLLELEGKVTWEGRLDEMRTYDKWAE